MFRATLKRMFNRPESPIRAVNSMRPDVAEETGSQSFGLGFSVDRFPTGGWICTVFVGPFMFAFGSDAGWEALDGLDDQ